MHHYGSECEKPSFPVPTEQSDRVRSTRSGTYCHVYTAAASRRIFVHPPNSIQATKGNGSRHWQYCATYNLLYLRWTATRRVVRSAKHTKYHLMIAPKLAFGRKPTVILDLAAKADFIILDNWTNSHSLLIRFHLGVPHADMVFVDIRCQKPCSALMSS